MCFCDEARLNLLRRNAQKRQEKSSYDGKCRHLSEKTIQTYLNEKIPYVIRFKLENKDVSFNDLTTGLHKSNPFNQEGDFVIIKSDKFPTYHFANVVDDHLMKITHVFRGQEWQLSTAKHIQMYEAFGWQHPIYSHLPLICNIDGSKISKRQNDIDILSYKERGYLPETLLAYLSTIGGGLKINILDHISLFNDTSEVMPKLIQNFDETNMNSKSVKLNQELLDNLNKKFIQLRCKSNKNLNKITLYNQLRSLLVEKFTINDLLTINEHYLSEIYLKKVIEWSMNRVNKLNDLVNDGVYSFLWSDMSNSYKSNSEAIDCNKETILNLIEILEDYLQRPTTNNSVFHDTSLFKKELSNLFSEIKFKKKINDKKINYWKLTRLILTGSEEGPPVADIFILLEKDILFYRLNIAKNALNNNNSKISNNK
jgi:glutamyl-tRNA synthetase